MKKTTKKVTKPAPKPAPAKVVEFRDAKIETMSLSKLSPAAYNPRVDLTPDHETYKSLKRSIEEFGFVEPLVWNKRSGNLVGGHQRFKVMLDMGVKESKVVVVDLDDAKEKALNVALNKIQGGWDDQKLAALLGKLSDAGFDVTVTGYGDEEIARLQESAAPTPPENFPTFNEHIPVDYKCPKCNYQWSGKAS